MPIHGHDFPGEWDCKAFNGQRMTNHYAYNAWLGADDSYGIGYFTSADRKTVLTSPMTMSQVAQPANVVSHFHSGSVPPYGATWGCVYVTIEQPDFYNKIRPRVRHKNGDNFAFVDGHAKWIEVKQADSAGQRPDIFIWATKGMWMWPYYPDNPGGFAIQ